MAERRGKTRGLRRAVTAGGARAICGGACADRARSRGTPGTRVGTLSGGQRQALALLMATMSGSRLLLLDEHLAALDPQDRRDRDDAHRAASSPSSASPRLMVTHKMQDAIRWGNRLIMMHAGRIIFDVRDAAKAALTVDALVAKFHAGGKRHDRGPSPPWNLTVLNG